MTDSQAWILSGDQNGISVSDSLDILTRDGGEVLQTKLATHIVGEAKSASLNSRRDGPFAREVQRRYPGENYRGGKVDDICVVVAVVVENKGEVEGSRMRERARL